MARPGTFKPGKSGNPSGRPKKTPELIEVENLCKQASPDAVERLKFWMSSDNPRASVTAATGILDRAWGKPKQAVVGGDPNHPIRVLAEIRRTIVDAAK